MFFPRCSRSFLGLLHRGSGHSTAAREAVALVQPRSDEQHSDAFVERSSLRRSIGEIPLEVMLQKRLKNAMARNKRHTFIIGGTYEHQVPRHGNPCRAVRYSTYQGFKNGRHEFKVMSWLINGKRVVDPIEARNKLKQVRVESNLRFQNKVLNRLKSSGGFPLLIDAPKVPTTKPIQRELFSLNDPASIIITPTKTKRVVPTDKRKASGVSLVKSIIRTYGLTNDDVLVAIREVEEQV